MRQSQQNLRYREIKENNPTHHSITPAPIKPQKLSIHWESGEKALFYYSYLISIRLRLDGELNVMTLKFMSNTVILKGYNLDCLFSEFVYQEPQIIEVRQARYAMTEIKPTAYVIEVILNDENCHGDV